jgi:hypothetical protein
MYCFAAADQSPNLPGRAIIFEANFRPPDEKGNFRFRPAPLYAIGTRGKGKFRKIVSRLALICEPSIHAAMAFGHSRYRAGGGRRESGAQGFGNAVFLE